MFTKKSKKMHTIIAILALSFLSAWIYFNPPGSFGFHIFGLTTYSGIPFPAVDLVVDSSSIIPALRAIKDHMVSEDEFDRLIGKRADDWPQYVIIGNGYESRMEVADGILIRGAGPVVECLPTPEAIERFNELKSQGLEVKAIIHSTC